MKRFRNFPLSYESRITADETGFSLSISSTIYVLYMYYTFLRYFPNLSIPNFFPLSSSHSEPPRTAKSSIFYPIVYDTDTSSRASAKIVRPALLWMEWNRVESRRETKISLDAYKVASPRPSPPFPVRDSREDRSRRVGTSNGQSLAVLLIVPLVPRN